MRNDTQKNIRSVEKENIRWWQTSQARITGLIVGVLALLGIVIWWFAFRPYVSTDDARVDANIISLANQGISGQIDKIFVTEGDKVTAGMVLIELDHSTAKAKLEQAEARARFTALELTRMQNLAAHQGTSRQQVDRILADSAVAQAELKLARIALSRTYLKSPADGTVIRKVVEAGNILETNQTAVTIADLDHAWISANIEETKVGLVHPGQIVSISVDEGGSLKGKVMEVRKATAATFALIPSDSAQGNFIKQVQRIPIKISIDPRQKRVLRVGQSVEISIRVR